MSNAQNRILSNPRWKTVFEVPICKSYHFYFFPLFAFFFLFQSVNLMLWEFSLKLFKLLIRNSLWAVQRKGSRTPVASRNYEEHLCVWQDLHVIFRIPAGMSARGNAADIHGCYKSVYKDKALFSKMISTGQGHETHTHIHMHEEGLKKREFHSQPPWGNVTHYIPS